MSTVLTVPEPGGAEPVAEVVPAPRRRRRRLLPRHFGARIALGFLIVGVLAAIFAPAVSPYDPNEQSLLNRLAAPSLFGGEGAHLLGTDELGRDLLSRAIYGGRVSFTVGFVAATFAGLLGTVLGVVAGYYRGIVESVIMRTVDILTAFPFLIVALAVVAVFGAKLSVLIIVLVLWEWVPFTRLAHAKTLNVVSTDYFRAAVAIGRRGVGILARHVLPNIAGPLIVVWTFVVARSIVIESSLSFLGLGVPPPTATWGGMLSASRGYLDTAWWIPLVPGVAITLVVLSVNVVGDWLSERWDPHGRR
ncbi:ABC transporter permease [Micromonospora sp. RP3T]|uniref:ABC transporter permease n=1 Tax=Micromonospora sp. RP3T TaxID=2135446 RepID=UPI000D17D04C|nr:ABC transporter permease [Micromonospora sp. RP3T]PTA47558.1 peptide ABC transporter permease [Micromonospora sp. RP3T]